LQKLHWSVFVLVAVFALVLTVGACAEKTTIVIAHPWGGESGEAFKKVVDLFNESQDEIRAEGMYAPYADISQEKLLLMMASGSPPDVAMLADLLIAEYAESGGIKPLDNLVARDQVLPGDYWEAAWRVTEYKGQHWAMPYTNDSRALYFNKDMFEKAGLDSRCGPQTLDELAVYARKLTLEDSEGSIVQFGFVPWRGEGWFYTWGWLFGGQFYDRETLKITADHPRNIVAMEWIEQYASNYPPGSLSGLSFWSESGAMVTAGNWNLAGLNNQGINYGVCPLPPPEGYSLSTWSGIWTLAIPTEAPHPEAAWEFVRFACGQHAQEVLAATAAQLPAHTGAAAEVLPGLKDTISPYIETFVNLLPFTHHRPTIPVGSFYWNQMVEAQNSVVSGSTPPSEALKKVTQVVQAKLDEFLGQ